MRRILLILFLVSVMMVASIGMANAESILFPYISNGDDNTVDTIVSIINTAPSAGVIPPVVTQLHYHYMTKAADGSANEDINPCNENDFRRPTTQNDLVTFAVGRSSALNFGNAMFNDPQVLANYNAGVGAPNFGHTQGHGRRGLLMVTTSNNNLDCGVGNFIALDGEAQSYDIVSGAMWGYSALTSRQDAITPPGAPATLLSYIFARPDSVCAGTTRQPLLENNALPIIPRINVFPPDQFTNTLLVTPLMSNNGTPIGPVECAYFNPATSLYGMNSKVVQVGVREPSGIFGMLDRDEGPVTGGVPNPVRCIARVDLTDITGGLISPLQPGGALFDQGGWAFLDLLDPTAIAAPAPAVPDPFNAAQDWQSVVYGLKYGVITGEPGIINDGRVVCDWFNPANGQGGCR